MKSKEEDLREKLAAIIPGRTYPESIVCHDIMDNQEPLELVFMLHSTPRGMECLLNAGNVVLNVYRDPDNTSFVRDLLKDLHKAIERGATLEIGEIRVVQTFRN